MTKTPSEPARSDVLRLAAETGLDPRTARRALLLGADALCAHVDRERAREAAKRLGLVLP